VRTYGDVSPGAPRLSARLLSTEQVPDGTPWWRVVRADGSLAVGQRQREHLQAEGVPFRGERVDMDVARIPHDP
jgi:alkylated DNA nucleotide flippase Atl1